MSRGHDDDEEPVTDINVEVDVSALAAAAAAGASAPRENVVTRPAPGMPADSEPRTPAPKLGVPGLSGRSPREARVPLDDDASTGELLLSSLRVEEDEKTSLNVESRVRHARVPLSDPPLEETKPRPASVPMLPKSDRTFSMDLPPTEHAAFPPYTQDRADAVPVGPRGPKGTVKIVSNADGQIVVAPVAAVVAPATTAVHQRPSAVLPPQRAQVPTVMVRARRRGPGCMIALALLAAVFAVGYVKRVAITQFVRTTTAALRN